MKRIFVVFYSHECRRHMTVQGHVLANEIQAEVKGFGQ